jgi:hypothetical protein
MSSFRKSALIGREQDTKERYNRRCTQISQNVSME